MAKKSDTATIKATSLFDHLGGLTYQKTSWESLSEMDRKSFSPFMVNRFLSMNMDYLELVNEYQKFTIGNMGTREVYKFYLDVLPKRKSFDKYVKGKDDNKWNENIIKWLCTHFNVSSREVMDYLEILPQSEVIEIIQKYGIKKEEIQKWLK